MDGVHVEADGIDTEARDARSPAGRRESGFGRTMIWPTAPCVLIVSDDVRCLNLMATELRAMGCRVLCARDLEQAAEVVRATMTTRFLLMFIADDLVLPADLCSAMAAHLPGWSVECDESGHERFWSSKVENRLVN
jgi:hypothetical protein